MKYFQSLVWKMKVKSNDLTGLLFPCTKMLQDSILYSNQKGNKRVFEEENTYPEIPETECMYFYKAYSVPKPTVDVIC